MSNSLLREIAFMDDLVPVELTNSTESDVPSALMYIGKQSGGDPVRIHIEEIIPTSNATIIKAHMDNQNPTLEVENTYQDLMNVKACLDNFVDESISCDGAKHEAFIKLTREALNELDFFPVIVAINGNEMLFPVGTSFKTFQETLASFGVVVGRTSKWSVE